MITNFWNGEGITGYMNNFTLYLRIAIKKTKQASILYSVALSFDWTSNIQYLCGNLYNPIGFFMLFSYCFGTDTDFWCSQNNRSLTTLLH